MAPKYHINPRFRAYGKARVDITRRAKDEREWQNQWREPVNPFPFAWGENWQFSFEYKVDDFAAEVGFYIDVLGFPVRAFSPSYAQFTTPGEEFCFGVIAMEDGDESTEPDSIRIQLNVKNTRQLIDELVQRGIAFEKSSAAVREVSPNQAGFFRTPHGVLIQLWGEPGSFSSATEDADDEDIDTDETDLLINKLLGLSGGMSDPMRDPESDIDDDEDLDNGDLDDDDLEETLLDEYAIESIDEEIEAEGSGAGMRDKEMNLSPTLDTETENHHSTQKRVRPGDAYRRNTRPIWPANNDRKNGELTYHQIDDALSTDEL